MWNDNHNLHWIKNPSEIQECEFWQVLCTAWQSVSQCPWALDSSLSSYAVYNVPWKFPLPMKVSSPPEVENSLDVRTTCYIPLYLLHDGQYIESSRKPCQMPATVKPFHSYVSEVFTSHSTLQAKTILFLLFLRWSPQFSIFTLSFCQLGLLPSEHFAQKEFCFH